MKLPSSAQIRDWDAYTIRTQGISSLALMERAATACADWIAAHHPTDQLFLILCGTGNNGGDGLALARLLLQKGYAIKTFFLRHSDSISPDCAANLEALRKADPSVLTVVPPDTFITELPPRIILIDAILGTGLNRPTDGWLARFLDHLNELPNPKIAIDIPSGLPADGPLPEGAVALKAQQTLSFGTWKRSFLHPETGAYAGSVAILDIGLDPGFPDILPTHFHLPDKAFLRSIYRPRQAFSHKGTLGLAFLIGGSYGLTGALLMATRAAGRTGAGKVRALVPECGYTVLQTAAPEAMCRTSGVRFLEAIEGWETAQGIGIGPGMGDEPQTVTAYAAFLEACKQPVVVDADAINILGKRPELISRIPQGAILTPHPKEFERVFGKTADSFARVELARTQAMKLNVHFVLKDRHTVVILPDGQCYYNVFGNSGLATGGSGDVLTGILAGLLAQGYPPADAALLGVYLHSAAGDAAAAKVGQEALIAPDIVDHIGAAYQTLNAT